MTPDQASKLTIGERIWFQADMIVPSLRNGIYTVLDVQDETVAGRRTVRIKVSDDPAVWARPGNLGRIAREQQRRVFE